MSGVIPADFGRLEDSNSQSGFSIEDIPYASAWMQDSKRRSKAFTKLLYGIFHIHTLIASTEGGDLLETLQVALKDELLLKRQGRHQSDAWVGCGLATALTAVLRKQQNSQVSLLL